MSELQTVETQVHRRATRETPAELARRLQEILGQELTAITVGVRDEKAVGRWASGKAKPSPVHLETLRHAYRVVELLLSSEHPDTVRAWMKGMNPFLAEKAPAMELRKNPAGVLEAARAFLLEG